jgi:hypothetical protein
MAPRGLGLTPEQMKERRRAQSAARRRAFEKRYWEQRRALRAGVQVTTEQQEAPKKRTRSVDKRLERSMEARHEWLRVGYQPSPYVAPPPGRHYAFDKMWWASLSHREQVKILSMPTIDLVSKYAAESKRRFADSNSTG